MAVMVAYLVVTALTCLRIWRHSRRRGGLLFSEAVASVVGSFVVGVVLMPDFTRFARTDGDTVTASFLPFMGISSFVYRLGLRRFRLWRVRYSAAYARHGTGAFGLSAADSLQLDYQLVNLYSAALAMNAVSTKVKAGTG